MKAVVLEAKKLRVRNKPRPVPSAEEALIQVHLAGICNTDLELVRGYMDFEGILGHEFVGIVLESQDNKWAGKRVVGEINLVCGRCVLCLSGESRHCPHRSVLGISGKDGVFAPFVTLPVENLHILPDSIEDREAVFIEPLAAALRILEQVHVREKDRVLILGDGKLGLLIAQVLRTRTDKVFCIGRHPPNLKILRKRGIETLMRLPDKKSRYDLIVEATGQREGLETALNFVKPSGTVVLKSTYAGKACLNFSQVVVDEIRLVGSRCGPFPPAISLLEKKAVEVKEMIDGTFSLEEAEKAFAEAQKPGVLKILLIP
ncbi:MAG: alcohol dehydrogenase catalytic domain-containing protein [Candidatus Aminicenantes bacterium]|nr:alcohol dehydrogenase catalytic domain-containing protein [Candidatus Aminicenantes bacterium]